MVAFQRIQDNSIWIKIERLAHGLFAWPNLATFEFKCHIIFWTCLGDWVGIWSSRRLLWQKTQFLPFGAGWRTSPRWRVTYHGPWDADGRQCSDGETVTVSRLIFQDDRHDDDRLLFWGGYGLPIMVLEGVLSSLLRDMCCRFRFLLMCHCLGNNCECTILLDMLWMISKLGNLVFCVDWILFSMFRRASSC